MNSQGSEDVEDANPRNTVFIDVLPNDEKELKELLKVTNNHIRALEK
jgi:hypothetical protein